MTAEEVIHQARQAGLKLVRFLYCDNGNIIRGKAAHIEALAPFLESGIGLTVAMQGFCITEHIAPGSALGPVGEIRLTPDLETFRVLPYSPGNGALLCDMTRLDGEPWEVCPRSFLKRMIAEAASEGVEIVAGFENEFYLARKTGDRYEPMDDSLCFSTAGMESANAVISEIVDALLMQGILLQQYYPELGPGQQEISIRHAPALRAADNQILVRETVRAVAAHHGLVVSFAPKPFPDLAGSGCHVHMSLWRDGRNLLYDPKDPLGISDVGYRWLGGILDHLPSLLAITCPSVNSYRRLRPDAWSSAFVCYGPDNREAAVRIPSPFRGRHEESTNFELKPVDGSANPYLALGAIIACGLDGLRRNLHPGPPLMVNPAALSERERAERGVRGYPASLAEAIANLEQDAVLLSAMGEALAREFLAVRRGEWEDFRDATVEAEAYAHFSKY